MLDDMPGCPFNTASNTNSSGSAPWSGFCEKVHSTVADLIPAGGHQMYAPLGGVFSQSRPLNLHVYGDLYTQKMDTLGPGKINIPVTAKQGVVPSIYTGHPSYAYPVDKTYDESHHFPGTVGFPARVEGPSVYPGGAPPLGRHSGVPASTGFPKLDSAGFVY
ncbi:hypothetical protein C0Q70_18592 [Pomacea canaliculata]|uniref:Uncharacterized protein n=1 Tax=Pomacea canaliculata TaxID=400727 RepID=A0A2T7NGX9_POMCA|nr:hypothetical protein C0Q70_18592 [Pomacea canaliculata]